MDMCKSSQGMIIYNRLSLALCNLAVLVCGYGTVSPKNRVFVFECCHRVPVALTVDWT